jgi:1-acyl-sn-glycerol-3-phosphate acyltransferase
MPNQRQREPLVSLGLYHLFKWTVVAPVSHLGFRLHIHGRENVPVKGAVVVVSNHASDFDPPILSHSVGRPVAFMAKEELFRVPILSQAIRLYGAYPVKRGSGDRQALKSALSALQNGWAVGIFLQGTRTPDGKITDPKLGAAMISAKFNAPLLPVCLWGTHHILPKGAKFPKLRPVTVRIGTPIAPPAPDRASLQTVTELCAKVINELHDLGR